ncbi:hypothetical protein ACOTJF_11470 [Achromobacter ruhlandii]|uniref:hypothetical protein n=1 Tax=Achromobacter ruhlandii TaxID=72557 RepID=UPI003B9DCD31
MQFYFSNTTKGFYLEEIHGAGMPEDAIALKDGEHAKSMEWQSKGGLISGVNTDGTMLLTEAAASA